jgi:hypothetical protein
VKQDCRKDEDILQEESGEDALFCTLCNAEVQVYSIRFYFLPGIEFLFMWNPLPTYHAHTKMKVREK